MSACPDCEALIVGYGAPDRRCDVHWREDNPNGIRMKFTVDEVDREVLAMYLGLDLQPGSTS